MADGLFALGGTGEFTGATPYSGACFTNNLGTTDGARHRHAPCGGSRGRLSVMTATTSGITSPARRTMTVSPMRTSKRAIWSALCKVTLVTVTPATCTGVRRATGVAAPVRPIWISMASTVVVCSWAGNLWAMAQRGHGRQTPFHAGQTGRRVYKRCHQYQTVRYREWFPSGGSNSVVLHCHTPAPRGGDGESPGT